MNRDHADALVTYARVLAATEADEASMTAIDRLGFRLRVRAGGELSRRAHPVPARGEDRGGTPASVLIEMLRDARVRVSLK